MTPPQKVTLADVRHVAQLARLGLTDDRAGELVRDLNTILEHMEALSRADTDGVAEAAGVGAAQCLHAAGMRLREDKGPAIPLAEPPASFAPEFRDGLFLVPRLATHEDAEESSA